MVIICGKIFTDVNFDSDMKVNIYSHHKEQGIIKSHRTRVLWRTDKIHPAQSLSSTVHGRKEILVEQINLSISSCP